MGHEFLTSARGKGCHPSGLWVELLLEKDGEVLGSDLAQRDFIRHVAPRNLRYGAEHPPSLARRYKQMLIAASSAGRRLGVDFFMIMLPPEGFQDNAGCQQPNKRCRDGNSYDTVPNGDLPGIPAAGAKQISLTDKQDGGQHRNEGAKPSVPPTWTTVSCMRPAATNAGEIRTRPSGENDEND